MSKTTKTKTKSSRQKVHARILRAVNQLYTVDPYRRLVQYAIQAGYSEAQWKATLKEAQKKYAVRDPAVINRLENTYRDVMRGVKQQVF